MGAILVVTGSREANVVECERHIYEFLKSNSTNEIWEGGCETGADLAARNVRLTRNIKPRTFHADWDTHGDKAGPLRNNRMIHCASLAAKDRDVVVLALLAFGVENRGTYDCISNAMTQKLPLNIRYVSNNSSTR